MERLGEDEIFCIYERISFLVTSPKIFTFGCHKPFSNNHMKLIAKSCPNIKDLDLSLTRCLNHEVGKVDFDDVGLCAIANACTNLDCVDLSGRLRFKEIGIGSLITSCKNLRELKLNYMNVNDKSLKMIGVATRLENLSLQGCDKISDVGLEYLANGKLKHCLKTLYLYYCDMITDNGIIILKKLVSLITLHLSNCDRITDNGIIHLKKLVNINTLHLSKCGANITDYGVVALCELPNLQILYLDFLTNITDISLLEIGRKCFKMLSLSLEGCNNITSVGLRAFLGHPTLYRLTLVSCYKLSMEDIKPILISCPKLGSLHINRSMEKPMRGKRCEYIEIKKMSMSDKMGLTSLGVYV